MDDERGLQPAEVPTEPSSGQAVSAPGELEARVAEVVGRLLAMSKLGARVEAALELGAIVVEGFFDGDSRRLRARGKKAVSVRDIARHPDCPFSARELRVGAELHVLRAALEARGEGDVLTSEHLSYSHVESIVNAPEPHRIALLVGAAAERTTVGALRERIAALRTDRRGGRPSRPALDRLLGTLRRAAQAVHAHLARDESGQDAATSEARAQAVDEVRELLALLERPAG